MGQSESKEEEPPHNNHRPPTSLTKHASLRETSRDKAKRAPAPPSSALAPTASTSTSTAHATATVSHSRQRSVTVSGARTSSSHEPPVAASHKSDSPAMGQSASSDQQMHNRTPSRSSTHPPIPVRSAEQNHAVPIPTPRPITNDTEDDFVPTGALPTDYGLAPSNFTRPPRLPLPIEEEVHTPGSPIISPQDLGSALEASEVDGAIPRQTSVLSSTTIDDDELGDDEYLPEPNPAAPIVPTKIEWKGKGDRIFVTGTFVNWERKFKLYRNKDEGGFSAILPLRPGTHHLKFLVDNDMVTSDDLPTTVDYTNILVNYIEVVAPAPTAPTQPPAPAEPMPIPGAAVTAGQAIPDGEGAATKPVDIRSAAQTAQTDADLVSTLQDPNSRKPSVAAAEVPETEHQKPATIAKKQKEPRPKYTNKLPDYLHDLDVYTNPEDERYQRANRIISQLPQPPSLPMFMSKSILNGQTPHKDDASVLIMPNHTVLNHLATSSIKNGVLATSGTTRYKRKFLTTIMYKPTTDDG